MVDAHLIGVRPVGPENFLCALVQLEGSARLLPVWLSPVEGARLLGRVNGWAPDRPHAIDALVSHIEALSGAESVELSTYHEGVVTATLRLGDGSEIDMRPSDALAAAVELEVPLEVAEEVAGAATFISPEDARRYLGFDVDVDNDVPLQPQGEESAASDDEFAELMRKLGVEEEDLGGDGDS